MAGQIKAVRLFNTSHIIHSVAVKDNRVFNTHQWRIKLHIASLEHAMLTTNKDWTAIQSNLSASPYGSKLSKNLNSMRNIISTFHHRTVETVDLSPQNSGHSWLITTEQWKQLTYHHRTVDTVDLSPQNSGNNWLITTEQWKQLTYHHRTEETVDL